jgi:hypothetical protein
MICLKNCPINQSFTLSRNKFQEILISTHKHPHTYTITHKHPHTYTIKCKKEEKHPVWIRKEMFSLGTCSAQEKKGANKNLVCKTY